MHADLSNLSIGLAFSVGLFGCTITEPYPTWFPDSAPGTCTAIEGSYRNRGASTEGLHPDLSDLLNKGSWSTAEEVSIRVTQNDAFFFWSTGSRSVGELQFSDRDGTFKCIDGTVELTYSSMGRCEQCIGLPVYEGIKLSLSKATDRSLIAKRERTTFGLVLLVIPAGAKDTHWFKFESIK